MVYRIRALQSAQDYREALDYLNRYASALPHSDEWREVEVVRALVKTYEVATYGNIGRISPASVPVAATGDPEGGGALQELLYRAVQLARAYGEHGRAYGQPLSASSPQYRFSANGTASITLTHQDWRNVAAALGFASAPPVPEQQ